MIDLAPDYLAIVERILAEHVPEYEVRAFGTRATWTAKDYSDLDLAVVGEGALDWRTIGRLKEAFEESTLPIRVDVLDWHAIPNAFREEIRQNYVVVQRGARPKGWRKVMLSEVLDVNPKRVLTRTAKAPFVSMADVQGHQRSIASMKTREYKGGGARFCNGDTLLARITPCLENGKTAWVTGLPEGATAHGSTEFIVLSAKEGVTDPLFVYYLARSPAFRAYAVDQMTGTSGRQRVPTEAVKIYEIAMPPLEEQRRIARVLGNLDDKIELNQRMSETLEEMAQALFKSWFVDFDPVRAKMEGRWLRGESLPGLPAHLYDLFPDRFSESRQDLIPTAWKVSTLANIAKPRRTRADPKHLSPDTPYIGLGKMPRKSIALESWETTESTVSTKSQFNAGDVLFGRLRPYFHKVGLAPVDGVCSTDIEVVVPQSRLNSAFVLCLTSSADFVNYTDVTSTGTRMPRTNWNTMSKYQFSMPPHALLKTFQKLTQPMLDRIVLNVMLNRTLSKVRNALLPRIVSGQHRLDSR